MPKKTAAEIVAEIKRLQAQRKLIPVLTLLGDDNLEALDAQVKVLIERMSEKSIWNYWHDEVIDQRVRYNAMLAYWWMTGFENESPADGWIEVIT